MRYIKSPFLFGINGYAQSPKDNNSFTIEETDVENSPLVTSLKEISHTYQIVQEFQRDVEFYNSLGPE